MFNKLMTLNVSNLKWTYLDICKVCWFGQCPLHSNGSAGRFQAAISCQDRLEAKLYPSKFPALTKFVVEFELNV